jgi:hypothetical protein
MVLTGYKARGTGTWLVALAATLIAAAIILLWVMARVSPPLESALSYLGSWC